MLHALDPQPVPAYPVPWRVDRTDRTHPRVLNASETSVEFVRVFRTDSTTEHWGTLERGEAVEVCLCGTDLDEVVITLCWFRSSTAEEYAWRFVM